MNKNLLYILLATSLIALAPIFSEMGVPSKGIWVYSFYTLLSATVSLFIFALIKKEKIAFSKDFIWPIIFSILGGILFFYSFNFISGVSAGFLGQSQLIFTFIFSYFLLKENLNLKKLIALSLVVIGSFVIYFQESLSFNQIGVLSIIGSMFFFSIVNVLNKKLREKHSAFSINFYKGLVASIVYLIFCLIFSFDELFIFDTSILLSFSQGIICDVLGWTLFLHYLKQVKVNTAFIIYSFSSIFTLIYSFFVFGLNIIQMQLIGGLLILIGNILFNK